MNFFSKEQLQKIREDKIREFNDIRPQQRIEHNGQYGKALSKHDRYIEFIDNATGDYSVITQLEYVSCHMAEIEINNTIADEIREGTLQEHFVAGK